MITLDNNRLKYLLTKITSWVSNIVNRAEGRLNDSINKKTDQPLHITYADLKQKVRNSELIIGQQYIITDYKTTSYQEHTFFNSSASWGNLIVTAVSKNELNPEAFYNGCKVWYCLENDTDRFAWIRDDSNTFKTYEIQGFVDDAIIPSEDDPVISEFKEIYYPGSGQTAIDNTKWFTIFSSESEYIEDPLQNEVYQKVRYYISEYEDGDKYYYDKDVIKDDVEYQIWSTNSGSGTYYTKKFVKLEKTEYTIDYSTGVIYRMIDEYGNDVPYDFKNILIESNELEAKYSLQNGSGIYDDVKLEGPYSSTWYSIDYGDWYDKWAIRDNGKWIIVKGMGTYEEDPEWSLTEYFLPKKYSTFYNGNNSNQTTDCSHLVRNCSIAPAVVDGVQVINNIRIDVSEAPLINIDRNCTNLNISGVGDITIHSGVSGTKENPIELFLSGSPHVYYEDNQVIVRSEKQLADDISNLQEDVRAIKVRDYFYESDDPEYGRKIFIYPKSSGDKESKYEILSLSSKGLPLEQDYVTVESITSSFGNIISASQGTALYQTGGEPSKSSELYYGYDRINLIKNQIERHCKVIPIKEFINSISDKDSEGKTSFSWTGSSGNGRLSIRITSVLEAYPEFYIEGKNKVTYKLCDLESANSSLSFSKISGTNIAIDGFKSIEGQSFSKYANCIDYLKTQDFNIVMKLINPVIQPVEAEGLIIDNTSFTREKNTTEWIDFGGGCVELAYLSTTEYLYTKDQIDNKFYSKTQIDNNFLKNSENIYIDGLDEFKDEEEEISLQDVLRKINSNGSVDIDSIEDKSIPYSKLADDVTTSIVATLTDSAPETLNTLNELAAALGDDPNFAVTMTTELGKKATKTELESKADTTGSYPEMSVGLADDLGGTEFTQEFNTTMRRTANGQHVKDGAARIESIKGNSVVWNQGYPTGWTNLYNGITSTSSNGVIVSQGTLREGVNTFFTCKEFNNNVENAVYLFTCEILEGASQLPSTAEFALFNRDGFSKFTNGFAWFVVKNTTPSRGKNIGIRFLTTGQEINLKWRICQHNLTQMFQAGNEPTTIEEFYARIPMGVDLNAYNEGEVIHMDVQSIESVGVNQWDEEWELGRISTSSGSLIESNTDIRSKNFIPVMPNVEYHYFGASSYYIVYYDESFAFVDYWSISGSRKLVVPNNVRYVKLSRQATTYNHDICVNISDTSINGKYYPYLKRVEDLAVIRKYFPQGMKSAGTAHDEIRYNKATQKWEKVVRIGEVDMGTLNFTYSTLNGGYFYGKLEGAKTPSSWALVGNLLSGLYSKSNANAIAQSGATPVNMSIALAPNGTLHVVNTSYTDAASFKAAMQGVILYYELAEPIVTELDAEDQFKNLGYQVWNGGTESIIASAPSTPLIADVTYNFKANAWIVENRNAISSMGLVITSLKEQIKELENKLSQLILTEDE